MKLHSGKSFTEGTQFTTSRWKETRRGEDVPGDATRDSKPSRRFPTLRFKIPCLLRSFISHAA